MRRWTLRSASAGRPHQRQPQLLRQHLHEGIFRDGSGTHENASQTAAKPALQVERPLEFLAAHQPAFEQTLPQRYPLGRHLQARGNGLRGHLQNLPEPDGTRGSPMNRPAETQRTTLKTPRVG